MTRRRHHKAEQLSDRARGIIEDGLLGNRLTYEQISERVRAETKEEISPAAIGRYQVAKVQPRRDATLKAHEIAREMTRWADGTSEQDLARAIRLKTAQQLFPMLETLADEKPEMAASFFAQIEKARIDEKRLEQRDRELTLRVRQLEQQKQIADAKLEQIAKRLAKLDDAGKSGGRKLTRDELEKTLRSLYGIVEATPPAAHVPGASGVAPGAAA